MAQDSERKILRIGIIQNSKIIEERLLRKRESVSIGQSPRNTFVLPLATLPKSYPLFELRGGIYYLNFTDAMTGRLSVEDAVLDFDALRAQKLAKKRRDHYLLPLSERSRGKVVVGEVTLLFQFVVAPPPPSKLQLPAAARGGWVKNIDWPFVMILVSSAVMQTFSVAFVTTRDFPVVQGVEEIPDRFIELLQKQDPELKIEVKKDQPKDDLESDEKSDEKVPEKDDEKEKVKPKAKPNVEPERTTEEKARAKAERQRRIAKNVQNKTILKYIGSTGGDGPGSIIDDLAGGASDVKIAEAFDGASGVVVADRRGMDRDRRGKRGGIGSVAGLDDADLQAKGPEKVDTGAKQKEIKVAGKVKVSNPTEAVGTGMLDKAAVSQVVRRRQGALKSCYEKRLKRVQKLAGKVFVQITILESGRVGKAEITQNTTGDQQLADCISNSVQRWRFPKPDGGTVTFGFPFIFSPSS